MKTTFIATVNLRRKKLRQCPIQGQIQNCDSLLQDVFYFYFFFDEMLNKKLFYVVIVAVINLFHRGKGDIKVCNTQHFFLRKSARFGHV